MNACETPLTEWGPTKSPPAPPPATPQSSRELDIGERASS